MQFFAFFLVFLQFFYKKNLQVQKLIVPLHRNKTKRKHKIRPVRSSVRTQGFHPCKRGSTPRRATKQFLSFFRFYYFNNFVLIILLSTKGPFVHRLGPKVFILARGVRLPYGLQSYLLRVAFFICINLKLFYLSQQYAKTKFRNYLPR